MRRTWQRIYYAIATLRWSVLIAVIVLHALLSYFVLVVTGETALISDFLVYFYYYTTTATTVGYGDLSPQTAAGRTAAAIIILPGAIALFTAVLGKAVTRVSDALIEQGCFRELRPITWPAALPLARGRAPCAPRAPAA